MTGIMRVLVQLVTGLGKTNLAEDIIRDAVARGVVCWFIADRDNLISNAARRFRRAGLDVGIIKAGHKYDPTKLVQVCSIQSLQSRFGLVVPPDLAFIDEAHHSLTDSYGAFFSAYPKTRVVGLTGTPWLLDGRGLNVAYEVMLCGPKPSWAIAEGFLLPCRMFGSSRRIRFSKQPGSDDFDLELAEKQLARREVLGDAVAEFRRLFPSSGRAIAYCCSIAHAQAVAAEFNAGGVPAEILVGETDEEERDAIFERLASQETRVIAAVDALSEGTDVPELECVVMLRPTESLRIVLQQEARAIRPVYADGFDLETREGRLAAIAASGKMHATITAFVRECFSWCHVGVLSGHDVDLARRRVPGGCQSSRTVHMR